MALYGKYLELKRYYFSNVDDTLSNGDNLRQSPSDKYKTYKKLYYDSH